MKNILVAICLMALFTIGCQQEKHVYIETDYGTMKAVLFDSTPKHKANFIKLVEEGYYDGTLFHRIIPGFMIQGGDPDSKTAKPGQSLGVGGPDYRIDAEIEAKHYRGALSAARMGDAINPEKKSSGSQFFVVQGTPQNEASLKQTRSTYDVTYTEEEKENYYALGGFPALDGGYTVFGQVIEGLEVIDKIAKLQRDGRDRPQKDVKMKIYIK